MKTPELKPCPFCGVQLVKYLQGVWKHPYNDCFLIIANNADYVVMGESEAWNRRASDEDA